MSQLQVLLDGLPETQRAEILQYARIRRFSRSEVVFHEGDTADTLHLIRSGRVAIKTTTLQGDVVTLTVLGPGESFGELSMTGEAARRTASAVALEATETLSLHRAEFDKVRAINPAVDRILVDVLAEQVRRLSEHLLEALYLPVHKRVLRRLLRLVEVYRDDAAGPVVVPLSQDDLASMAGTSRPTANKVLREAEERGLIRIERRRIHVVDLEGLQRRAR